MQNFTGNALSRRSFLKTTGLGVGILATSAPSMALHNTINQQEGAVATGTLKNAGLLEQAQVYEQYTTLVDALKLPSMSHRKILIVLGTVTNQPYPHSVDNKLLFASLKHLAMQGVQANDITIAYSASNDLPTSSVFIHAAQQAFGANNQRPNYINTNNLKVWHSLDLNNSLPKINVAPQAAAADNIFYLGQLTDEMGRLITPQHAIASVLLEDKSVAQYAAQLDDLVELKAIVDVVFSKVNLIANNTTRFIAENAVGEREVIQVHPGILNMSNNMTSQRIFSQSYLNALMKKPTKRASNASKLTWLQQGATRDPLTMQQIESALAKSGVELKTAQI
ncbi:hypothetical protein PCIT_a1406 [Pseudoalteromonas citrea]|uniref:Uncharacterized protein n=2 Tax=Pseudoalteromonas citrea TaxID=43655 RepID=A0AAD4AMB0_9GAMM|nr:twin-arginine translocation signal domain-containing protein [Pseudoalteromonas citrea]KAF7775255.1 hypothetical protein PCIT_a1406 [Pseudoalteromonas citrea]